MGLRITTWNVNGIRNPFGYQPWRENRTYQAMFDTLEADIVVIQEAKIQRKDLKDDMVLVPGWDVYFSLPKYKKGYSGVAIYTRSSRCCPIRAEEGITGVLCSPNSSTKFRDLPIDQQIGGYPKPGQLSSSIDEPTLDSEGRCVILEFPAFVLIGVYSPATRDDTRTEFRQGFLDALDARVRNLVAMGKQVVLCGDLNIIRSDLDTAGLPERLRKESMTLEDFFSSPSRRFFNQMVHGGQVVGERDRGREEPVLWDLCREFHPTRTGMYTCWETRTNARPGNYGSRIDYVLCSSGIKDWFIDSNIQEGLMGSDHCPVYATLGDMVRDGATKVPITDVMNRAEVMNRAGMFMDGANVPRDMVRSGCAKVPITDVMNPAGMFKDGKRLRDWSAKYLLPMSAKLIPEFDRRRSIRDMFMRKATPSSKSAFSTPKPEIQETLDSADTASRTQETLGFADAASSTQKKSSTPQDNSFSVSQSSAPPTPKAVALHELELALRKRPAELPASSNRPQKKKATLGKDSAKPGPGLAQSSLRGFFKSKTPVSDSSLNKETEGVNDVSSPQSGTQPPAEAARGKSPRDTPVADDVGAWLGDGGDAGLSKDGKVFDPIQSKESWSKLLGKRTLPKCEHGEDCQLQVTKKAGINCGRSFYACSRPIGPTGERLPGTEFRCRTFIWSSDWSGRS